MRQRCHVSLRFDGLNSTRCLEVSSSGVMSFEETHLISILLPAVVCNQTIYESESSTMEEVL